MAQYSFGSGVLWGIPTADANGTAIANPTPVQFGVLQDVSVDLGFETKLLYGQNQFPVSAGRGKGKISGKAKFAQVNGALFNSLFFGQTMTSGIIADVYATSGIAIPATPFQITVTPPNSGTYSFDLGVRDANGVPMTRVASAPATGQYSQSGAIYTFAAADTGKIVYINYQYTASSTTAKKIGVINLPMGYAPTFRAELSIPYNGQSLIMTLPNCIANKLQFGTKLDDFTIPEFAWDSFADSAGNVLTLSLSE
jgi:hypothetical protein